MLATTKGLKKFILLCGLIAIYTIYLIYKYDFIHGGLSSILTWSFFVLCTPIADAGFLLDFPMRLLFGFRMIFTEIIVWLIAISINLTIFFFYPIVYKTTALTKVFYHILTTPYPYWLIIILSALGTFISVYFGDEVFDIASHKNTKINHNKRKIKNIATVIMFIVIIFLYYKFIKELGLSF